MLATGMFILTELLKCITTYLVCHCLKSVQDNELDNSDLDSSNDEEEWNSDSSR